MKLDEVVLTENSSNQPAVKEDYKITVITKMETTNKNRYLPRPLEDDDYDKRREMERERVRAGGSEIENVAEKKVHQDISITDEVSLTDKFEDPEINFIGSRVRKEGRSRKRKSQKSEADKSFDPFSDFYIKKEISSTKED